MAAPGADVRFPSPSYPIDCTTPALFQAVNRPAASYPNVSFPALAPFAVLFTEMTRSLLS